MNGYADIERGIAQDPHISSLASIARALGLTLAELLEEPVPLGEAPESGLTEALAQLVKVPFPEVLEMSDEELEDLRERARSDDSEGRLLFAALHREHSAVAEDVEVLREADEPPPDMAELEARHRILRKLWKVVLFERIAPTVNKDPRRGPDAPMYQDTTSLPLDDAYDVRRGSRVPAGMR